MPGFFLLFLYQYNICAIINCSKNFFLVGKVVILQKVYESLRAVIKRPEVLIFPGVLVLLTSVISIYYTKMSSPTSYLFFSIFEGVNQSAFEMLKSLLMLAIASFSIHNPLLYLVAVIVASFIIALIANTFLSGYIYIIKNTLEKRKKSKSDFIKGIKKYYIKFLPVSAANFIGTTMFIVFVAISIIPFIIFNDLANAKNPLFFNIVILFGFISFLILYILYIFFRAYMIFWYPSAIFRGKDSFRRAKKLVDERFFFVAWLIILFDGLYIIYSYANFIILRGNLDNTPIMIASFSADIIFKTFLFAFSVTYVVSLFKSFHLAKKRRKK